MDCFILKVPINNYGKEDFLYPVILKNDNEMILVDCAYPGFMPLLEEAANHHGLSLENLTGIILTHHDIDHVGAVNEIKSLYPACKLYSSEVEALYISGKVKAPRLQQAEDMFNSLPEDQKPGALFFQDMLRNIKPVAIDETVLNSADTFFMKDVLILNTPGHSPGHISIYLKDARTLIAADALVIEGGEFEIANPHFTLDLKGAVQSIRKIESLEIDRMICYHGGEVRNDIKAKLGKLIARYTDH